MRIIGIDVGTTKIAGVLLDLPENKPLKVISLEHNADIKSPNRWEQIQNPDKMAAKAEQIVRHLKDASDRAVDCIGISSQMHGCVYVSENCEALSPLYTWLDGRASIPLNRNGESVLELISKKTGRLVFSGYGITTHYYNYRKELVPEAPYKIVTIGGYVAMKLCGSRRACIDPSEGASFGFYDAANRSFHREDIELLFGDTDFLPEEVAFYFSCGYDPSGVPVMQSLGDNQASFLGAMQGHEEDLLINIGTGGQISFLTEAVPEKLKGIEIRPFPGKNLVVGAALSGGKTYALLIEFFHDVLSLFNRKMEKKEMMKRINDMSVDEPENPLSIVSAFNGTRIEPEKRGEIKNIDLNNFNAVSLIFGFVEAMVMELKTLFDENDLDRYASGQELVGSGNAVRQNSLLRALIEKQFNKPLILSNNKEEAACGAAYYAYRGITADRQGG